jgi:hypothetical protein
VVAQTFAPTTKIDRVSRHVMTMTMSSRHRRFVLTTHVISSVGWLGAAAAYLVLAVDVPASQDAQMVRAAVLVMELIAWLVTVPMALASPFSGIVQSLGTTWGLFGALLGPVQAPAQRLCRLPPAGVTQRRCANSPA